MKFGSTEIVQIVDKFRVSVQDKLSGVLLSKRSQQAIIKSASLSAGLVKGSNIVGKLLERAAQDPANQTKYYRQATDLTYSMLHETLENDFFRVIITELALAQNRYRVELRQLVRQSEQLEEFVRIERELLEAYDVPRLDYLMVEIKNLLKKMHVNRGYPIGVNIDIYQALENLRIAIHNLHKDLSTQPITSKKEEQLRKILIQSITVTGGIVITLANAKAQIDGTLPPVQATLSEQVGSGIIGAGAADVLAYIGKKLANR